MAAGCPATLMTLEAPQTNFQEAVCMWGESVCSSCVPIHIMKPCVPLCVLVCHTSGRGRLTIYDAPTTTCTDSLALLLCLAPQLQLAFVPCFNVAPGNKGNTRTPKFRLAALLEAVSRNATSSIFFWLGLRLPVRCQAIACEGICEFELSSQLS